MAREIGREKGGKAIHIVVTLRISLSYATVGADWKQRGGHVVSYR